MSALFFENIRIGEFMYPIRNLLDLTDRYVILLEIPSTVDFPDNIFCYSKKGEKLWQIEKKEMPHKFSTYYSLAYTSGSLLVYSSSIERIVDLNTGKIIKTDFIK